MQIIKVYLNLPWENHQERQTPKSLICEDPNWGFSVALFCHWHFWMDIPQPHCISRLHKEQDWKYFGIEWPFLQLHCICMLLKKKKKSLKSSSIKNPSQIKHIKISDWQQSKMHHYYLAITEWAILWNCGVLQCLQDNDQLIITRLDDTWFGSTSRLQCKDDKVYPKY